MSFLTVGQGRWLPQVLDSQPDPPIPPRSSHAHAAHKVRHRADGRFERNPQGYRLAGPSAGAHAGGHADLARRLGHHQLPRADHQPPVVWLPSMVLVGSVMPDGREETGCGLWHRSLYHHVRGDPGGVVCLVSTSCLDDVHIDKRVFSLSLPFSHFHQASGNPPPKSFGQALGNLEPVSLPSQYHSSNKGTSQLNT